MGDKTREIVRTEKSGPGGGKFGGIGNLRRKSKGIMVNFFEGHGKKLQCSAVHYAGINFIHNHPPPGHDLKGVKTLTPGQSL